MLVIRFRPQCVDEYVFADVEYNENKNLSTYFDNDLW